jgi:hypothetical protein
MPEPASFAPLIAIAQRSLPFTAVDGQAFVRLPGPSGGFYILRETHLAKKPLQMRLPISRPLRNPQIQGILQRHE